MQAMWGRHLCSTARVLVGYGSLDLFNRKEMKNYKKSHNHEREINALIGAHILVLTLLHVYQ